MRLIDKLEQIFTDHPAISAVVASMLIFFLVTFGLSLLEPTQQGRITLYNQDGSVLGTYWAKCHTVSLQFGSASFQQPNGRWKRASGIVVIDGCPR